MKILPLPSQESLQELFDYDPNTGHLRWKIDRSPNARIGMIAGTPNSMGYRMVRVDGKMYIS